MLIGLAAGIVLGVLAHLTMHDTPFLTNFVRYVSEQRLLGGLFTRCPAANRNVR